MTMPKNDEPFVPSYGQSLPIAPEATGEGKVTQQKRWRLADIQRMGAEEYGRNLASDPDFRVAVDEFFVPPAVEKVEEK